MYLVKRLSIARKNKNSKIIIVAEGDESGGAYTIAEQVKKRLPEYDTRITVLGHIQRGGNPTCMDRVNSSRLGYAAVNVLKERKKGVMVGVVDKKIAYTPFENAVKHLQQPDPELLKMVEILSL